MNQSVWLYASTPAEISYYQTGFDQLRNPFILVLSLKQDLGSLFLIITTWCLWEALPILMIWGKISVPIQTKWNDLPQCGNTND